MSDEDEEEEIKVPEIGAIKLNEMLASNNPPYLLDVREQWEVSRGMIPGAAHIAMNTIPDRLADIPQDKPIVVYCAVGARSYAVAAFLLENGFKDVMSLEGGIGVWAMTQAKRG
jgi:rhodanese-related sulfurtransferase